RYTCILIVLVYVYNRDIHSFPTRRSSDLSQNDTLADRDREAIQKEINALKESINSMASNTSYNDSLKAVEMHEAQYGLLEGIRQDRKSTRLNSSHVKISYAVFCLKKKKNK